MSHNLELSASAVTALKSIFIGNGGATLAGGVVVATGAGSSNNAVAAPKCEISDRGLSDKAEIQSSNLVKTKHEVALQPPVVAKRGIKKNMFRRNVATNDHIENPRTFRGFQVKKQVFGYRLGMEPPEGKTRAQSPERPGWALGGLLWYGEPTMFSLQ